MQVGCADQVLVHVDAQAAGPLRGCSQSVCQLSTALTAVWYAVAGLFCYPEPTQRMVEQGICAVMTVFILSQTAAQPLVLNKVR